MKPVVRGRTAGIFKLTFLFVLLFSIVGGCKKDDTSTTAPPVVTYPSVAGHWVGNLHVLFYPGPVVRDWSVVADFTQLGGGSLAGSWLYNLNTDGTFKNSKTLAKFIGTITVSSQVAIAETSWEALNWSGVNWGLNSYVGVLSAGGDTLYGQGADTLAQGSGTFVLVKQ